MKEQEQFEEWALLELFGHQRIAGKVTNATIGGGSFIRVDVPGTKKDEVAFTRYYSPSSIYSISPVTERVARALAAKLDVAPVSRWDLPQLTAGGQS